MQVWRWPWPKVKVTTSNIIVRVIKVVGHILETITMLCSPKCLPPTPTPFLPGPLSPFHSSAAHAHFAGPVPLMVTAHYSIHDGCVLQLIHFWHRSAARTQATRWYLWAGAANQSQFNVPSSRPANHRRLEEYSSPSVTGALSLVSCCQTDWYTNPTKATYKDIGNMLLSIARVTHVTSSVTGGR